MQISRGIILSGGMGTRLYPITKALSKQLLPVYDKPMIYYPISTLMMAGVREIQIISNPEYIEIYKKLLGSGKKYGIKFSYLIQKKPEGIAQSILLSAKFIKNRNFYLILGDNLFYDQTLYQKLQTISQQGKPYIFLKKVKNPKEYGVANFNNNKKLISILEKPKVINSNYAATGLYYYDKDALKIAKSLKPSPRGELEISDLNNCYINKKNMNFYCLSINSIWLDMGSHDKLLEASLIIKNYQIKRKINIGSIEETAYKKKYINKRDYLNILELNNSIYFKKIKKNYS